tara:strand:+ start:565 stop:963 length:399 start_codon:yes stop_codon:yes gene_type:complete
MNEYSLILKIVVGVIIIILIFVAINTFLKSQKTHKLPFFNYLFSESKNIALVYSSSCPHCKSMINIFYKLMSSDKTYKIINGIEQGQKWLRTHKIRAFPALVTIDNNGNFKNIEYGAKSEAQILNYKNSFIL